MLGTFPVAEDQEENRISCQRWVHLPHAGQARRDGDDILNWGDWESQSKGKAISLQVGLDDSAGLVAGTGLPDQQQHNSDPNLTHLVQKMMDTLWSNVKRNSIDGAPCYLLRRERKHLES